MRWRTGLRSVLSAAMLVAGGWFAHAAEGESAAPLVLRRAGVRLYASEKNSTTERILEMWSGWFMDWGDKPTVVEPSKPPLKPVGQAAHETVIAFETEAACPVAKAAGIDLERLRAAKSPEGYLFTAKEWEGRPLVCIVGKTVRGADAGAQWLRTRLHRWKLVTERGTSNRLTIDPIDILRAPCCDLRQVGIYDAGSWQACYYVRENESWRTSRVPYVQRQVGIHNWTARELARYVDYIHAAGCNGVINHGNMKMHWGSRMRLEYLHAFERGENWEAYEDRVYAPMFATLGKAAHERGMTMALHYTQWAGWSGWEGEKRAATEERFRELARKFGPHVDFIDSHWFDPGGYPGDTAVVEAVTCLRDEFRKINPAAEARVWGWGGNPWKSAWGFEKSEKRQPLDPAGLPKISIALGRWDPKLSTAVQTSRKAGYKVGVHHWYFCDHENDCGDWLPKMKNLETFGYPPPEKGGPDFVAVDRCWHAVPADINIYIAGQKLWDASRSVKEIAMDFLKAVYGPENAETMWTVYDTLVQHKRGRSKGTSEKYDAQWTPTRLREAATHAKAALGLLRTVSVSSDYVPAIQTPNTPQGYIVDLERDLAEIITEAALLEADAVPQRNNTGQAPAQAPTAP